MPSADDLQTNCQKMSELSEMPGTRDAEKDGRSSTLLEAARSVQLAEACYRSHRERRWVDLPSLTL